MTQIYTPNARDAEMLRSLIASVKEYDGNRLADCLMSIALTPQDIGLTSRAIATVAAERVRPPMAEARQSFEAREREYLAANTPEDDTEE